MIILQNLTKTFGARDLFKNISYNFVQNAKIALVGNNGEGKTTILNILCGFDKDFSGTVIVPKVVKLGYLPQEVNLNPKATILEEALEGAVELNIITEQRRIILEEMAENFSEEIYAKYEYLEQMFHTLGGYKIKDLATTILQGFGFSLEQFELAPHLLSGGWRMRLEFAKILLNKPNFLILDEPTNHLDLPSIEWLENYLKRFEGTILFVSHDRDLLTRLATDILHLRQGMLTHYKGNFNYFLDAFTIKQEQTEHYAKHLKREYDHIQKFVDRFRASPTKASMVQSRLKTLAKLKLLEDKVQHEELGSDMILRLDNNQQSGKIVLQTQELLIGYNKPLLNKLSINVARGQRIAILGANGLGKTTLLRTLLRQVEPLGGTITMGHNVRSGYFAQENISYLLENLTIIQNVLDSNSTLKEFDARKLLGSLGLKGDDVHKQVKILSGGEKSRVALACILSSRPNVLFLDEPTNHLDLYACENLANSFAEYTGTIIFISHNRAFIQRIATDILYIREKGSVVFESAGDDFG